MGGKRDEFIQDPYRVLVAAYNRLTASENGDARGIPGTAYRPIHDLQEDMLSEAIHGMETMSYELSSLHYAYRMALVMLGYDRRYLEMSDERMAYHEKTGEWL